MVYEIERSLNPIVRGPYGLNWTDIRKWTLIEMKLILRAQKKLLMKVNGLSIRNSPDKLIGSKSEIDARKLNQAGIQFRSEFDTVPVIP